MIRWTARAYVKGSDRDRFDAMFDRLPFGNLAKINVAMLTGG